MVQKRPYGEENLYKVSAKQARKVGLSYHQVPEFKFPCELVDWKTQISGRAGEGGGNPPKSKPEYDEKANTNNFTQFPICSMKDVETSGPETASNSSWVTSSTSEEDIREEAAPFHVLVSPACDEHYHPISPHINAGETYSSLLRSPPQKLVPIGKDFQAELPEWVAHDSKDIYKASDLSPQDRELRTNDHYDNGDYFAGTCVIPMPACELFAYSRDKVGCGREVCSCEDAGSVRCVQRHIMCAREDLRETLAQEAFVKLGFCDMGEVVAERWSEEEELLFHEVVFSNPSSLGRDFWDHLTIEFPTRTVRDIVSYYFNVFMLRKRAMQNRTGPLNIDSDNDECQGSEDFADEARTADKDDDSVVESPIYQVGPGCNEIFEHQIHEDDEDARDAILEDQYVGYGGVEFFSHVLDEFCNNCSFGHAFQPEGRVFSNDRVEQDVQDGSCTCEGGVAPETCFVGTGYQKHWTDSLCSYSNDHDPLLVPNSAKEWDVGYLSCPQKDVEFLPTCSMIEEVFGAGVWDFDSRDSQGLS